MKSELFPNLPEQQKPEREVIDLAELDQALEQASSSDLTFARKVEQGQQFITAYSKGLLLTYAFDRDNKTMNFVSAVDTFAESDGTPTDVAPRPLDSEKIRQHVEVTLREVIKELIDPALIEDFE